MTDSATASSAPDAPLTVGKAPESLGDSSNINATLAATAPHAPSFLMASSPVPYVSPRVEKILSEAVEQDPFFKKLQGNVQSEMESVAVVSQVLNTLLSGNKMAYLPADAIQAVTSAAMAHVAEYQSHKDINPNMNISQLMHTIGPGSHFFLTTHQFLDDHHDDHEEGKAREEQLQAQRQFKDYHRYHMKTQEHFADKAAGHEHNVSHIHDGASSPRYIPTPHEDQIYADYWHNKIMETASSAAPDEMPQDVRDALANADLPMDSANQPVLDRNPLSAAISRATHPAYGERGYNHAAHTANVNTLRGENQPNNRIQTKDLLLEHAHEMLHNTGHILHAAHTLV